MTARVVADLLGMRGKPWVLAMDRTNWEFGKTSINILMVSAIWNGMGVPLIWTLLPSAGNSNTKARTNLLDRLHKAFPDIKIASLMSDREFVGDGWMTYLRAKKIPFVLWFRENQHVVRKGYATSLAIYRNSEIARRLAAGLVEGAAKNLAVYRHDAFTLLGKSRHEPLKNRAKPLRIEQAKQPAERVVAGHAVLELEKAAQKRLFRLREQAHVHRPLRSTQSRAHGYRQYLMEVVKRGVSRARIVQPIPASDEILQNNLPTRDSFATR